MREIGLITSFVSAIALVGMVFMAIYFVVVAVAVVVGIALAIAVLAGLMALAARGWRRWSAHRADVAYMRAVGVHGRVATVNAREDGHVPVFHSLSDVMNDLPVARPASADVALHQAGASAPGRVYLDYFGVRFVPADSTQMGLAWQVRYRDIDLASLHTEQSVATVGFWEVCDADGRARRFTGPSVAALAGQFNAAVAKSRQM